MFTAKIKRDAGMVNILDAKWQEQGELLRGLTQRRELVCPHCGQDILLRDGEVRRRHFAHRTLADCPFKEQSAEVLDIKVLLYQWLESKLPGKVQMDCRLEMPGKEVYWDFLVEGENGVHFGFWIFDRQIRDRWERLDAAEEQGIPPIVFHAESVLSFNDKEEIKLTASQRDFMKKSKYDVAMGTRRSAYLNFADRIGGLKIFRGLHRVHLPNGYEWEVQREFALADAIFDQETGEIVCKEDVDALLAYEKLKAEQAQASMRPRVKESDPHYFRSGPAKEAPRIQSSPRKEKHRAAPPPLQRQNTLNQEYRCEKCGILTTDWLQCLPGKGTCVCSKCARRG